MTEKQYPKLPEPDMQEYNGYFGRHEKGYSEKLMRAYVDADRAMRAAQAAPAAWRHSRTYSVYEAAEQVPIADGDEWAEPLYLHPPEAPASQDVEDAARYQALAGYLVGPRTDIDDAIVHCRTVGELSNVIDTIRIKEGGNHE